VLAINRERLTGDDMVFMALHESCRRRELREYVIAISAPDLSAR
jgi:hypothetical protein